MLSIPTRAAVCIFGFALCGCMQSMPTAETVTGPTREAFTRLTAWSPWRSTPEQSQPVMVAAQAAAPVAEPVAEPPAPAVAPEPRPASKPAFHMPQLAAERGQPAALAPAAEAVPVVTSAAPAAARELRPRPKPAVHVPQLASTRSRPVTPPPVVPAKVIPVVTTEPAEAPAPSGLPARVTCQTASQPGERVRMECKPVE